MADGSGRARGALDGAWALALAMVLSGLLALRPVLRHPLTLAVGAVRTEAPRHFWGLWATAAHLREWGPFVAHLDVDWPSGYTRHLMDPINLVFFLPPYLVLGGGVRGAVAGYDAVHLGWALVGALGGWLLARSLLRGVEPAAAGAGALVAAVACGTAPYFLATPYLGRTELLPGLGWPLHLWFLSRALSDEGRLRDRVGAGLSLAAIALGGWYLAAWMLLFEPPVALAMARRARAPWRRRLGWLALIAVVAVVPVLPALHALLTWPPPVLHEEQRVSVHMGICTPPWLLLPFTGDIGLPGTDLPAYPGTVLFLLAVAGAAVSRRARGWLLLALALLVLSLGPFLVWTNDPGALVADPPRLPAWWVEKLLPPLRFIWGWCRLGILVGTPLAMAAAFAVARAVARWPALRPQLLVILVAGMAVDHAHERAPAGVSGFAFDPRPPPALLDALAALPPGAIVQLPFDDFYMTWQLAHGRPIAESLEIEDVRQQSYLVQHAEALIDAARVGEDPPFRLDDARVLACLRADARRMAEAGWAGVVVHRDRLPDAHLALTRLLTAALGLPAWDGERIGAWAFRGAPLPAGMDFERDCPVEEVEVIIPGGPPPGGDAGGAGSP